ncbi:hypothetical protein BGX28_001332, partial [Mortierella sp. GBA30]
VGPDPSGYPTVGYGHKCKMHDCSEVKYPFPLDDQTATELLMDDLMGFREVIMMKTNNGVHLNANQYAALVLWAFNVGPGNVETSSLLTRLNHGELADKVIASELPLWRMSNGRVLEGLKLRREAEVRLAQIPTDVVALPAICH